MTDKNIPSLEELLNDPDFIEKFKTAIDELSDKNPELKDADDYKMFMDKINKNTH